MGQLGSGVAKAEFLSALVHLLRDSDSDVQSAAALAVGGLGAAATPEILADLALLLRDSDKGVQSAAARAVGGLGAAAATPEILTALTLLFRDSDTDVQSAEDWAIPGLGAVATPELLATLAIHDNDGKVRSAVGSIRSLMHRGLRFFIRRRLFRFPAWSFRSVAELSSLPAHPPVAQGREDSQP
jgi:HEAT repeat protein